MDRSAVGIGDGKFTITKPDKQGVVKFRCARYFRNNEWKFRRSRDSGIRCIGGFMIINDNIVHRIQHSCDTLFPFAAPGETTTTTENATAATTPTAMMTAAVEETATTEATGMAMSSPVGLGIEDSITAQTPQTFATVAARISPVNGGDDNEEIAPTANELDESYNGTNEDLSGGDDEDGGEVDGADYHHSGDDTEVNTAASTVAELMLPRTPEEEDILSKITIPEVTPAPSRPAPERTEIDTLSSVECENLLQTTTIIGIAKDNATRAKEGQHKRTPSIDLAEVIHPIVDAEKTETGVTTTTAATMETAHVVESLLLPTEAKRIAEAAALEKRIADKKKEDEEAAAAEAKRIAEAAALEKRTADKKKEEYWIFSQ